MVLIAHRVRENVKAISFSYSGKKIAEENVYKNNKNIKISEKLK